MRKKHLWTLLLIPLIASIATINFAMASTNCVYVDPAVIDSTAYDIGDFVTVDLNVDYVANLWAYQVEMSFNPDVLQGVSVDNGDFLGSAIPPPQQPLYIIEFPGPGFDNVAGTLGLYGCAIKLTPPPPPWYFPTGSGTLATVTFEVVGYGISGLVLGPETGLFDPAGNELPPMSSHEHGLFKNVEGTPELYVRTRGAHGGGVWPEWVVGSWETDQTLYCRIMNYGDCAAEAKVKFIVVAAGYPKTVYDSGVATVPAATWVGGDIVPGEVVVSATFRPLGPGKFRSGNELYLGNEEYPYEMIVDLWGGVPTGKDTAVLFKATD